MPWIASRSLTYNDLAHMGRISDNTPDAWFAALDDMIQNIVAHKKIAWERRTWSMKKLTLEGNIGKYQGIIERVIADSQTRKGSKLPGILYVQQKAAQEVAA